MKLVQNSIKLKQLSASGKKLTRNKITNSRIVE